jgi:release factor glutamine methyltransferase
MTTAWVLAHEDAPVPPETEPVLEGRLERCRAGERLPYVLGWWEFYGRRFSVDARVLIPRPETELIVDQARAELGRRRDPIRVIDVGTGSGCIAVTLAAEAPSAVIVASDVSRPALQVARANAVVHAVADRLRLVQGFLVEGFACAWDLICANLPYIPSGRLPALAVSRHEPRLALDGGERGTALTGRLIRSLRTRLAPGGLALIEIDEEQYPELSTTARRVLEDSLVECVPDLAGRPRLMVIRRGDRVR